MFYKSYILYIVAYFFKNENNIVKNIFYQEIVVKNTLYLYLYNVSSTALLKDFMKLNK